MTDNERQKPVFQTFTAEQLLSATLEEPQFIVSDLLPCGFVLLAGAPKLGKSWLSLSLADAVANGRSFWGHSTNQGSCLYLALEDNEYRLQSRLKKLGIRPSTTLQFVTRGALTLRKGLLDQIENWACNAINPRIIIVDTLARIKDPGSGRNDMYTADTGLYAPLQQLAMKLKIGVLGITHFNKLSRFSGTDLFERIQGSTGLFGVADAALAISGKREDPEKVLSIVGRDVIADSFKIRFTETCRWEMLGSSTELEEQRKLDNYLSSPLRKTILHLLEANITWTGTTSQLLSEIEQFTQTSPGSVNSLGRNITAARQFFSEYDHVSFTQADGGAHGRAYTFYKNQ